MVLDVVEFSTETARVHAQAIAKLFLHVPHLSHIRQALLDQLKTRSVPQCKEHLLMQVGAEIARNSDVVQVACRDTCFIQTIVDGLGGEPRPILDPAEALLLDGGDELSVFDQAGRSASVVGINSENIHPAYLVEFPPEGARRCALNRRRVPMRRCKRECALLRKYRVK